MWSCSENKRHHRVLSCLRLHRRGGVECPCPRRGIVTAVWRRRPFCQVRSDRAAIQSKRRIVSYPGPLPVVLHALSRNSQRVYRTRRHLTVSRRRLSRHLRSRNRTHVDRLQFHSSGLPLGAPRAGDEGVFPRLRSRHDPKIRLPQMSRLTGALGRPLFRSHVDDVLGEVLLHIARHARQACKDLFALLRRHQDRLGVDHPGIVGEELRVLPHCREG